MIFDCFPFFNELEVLELRLNILYNYIDKFVIVEGNKTHTGGAKEFIFEQNKSRYEKFLDKIIYIKVDDFPSLEDSKASDDGNKWLYENYQRDAIMRGLVDCKDDDVIITSDCDEIPNPETIKRYRSGVCSLVQYRFKYNYNTLVINAPYSKSAKICRYSELKNPKKYVSEKHLKFCLYSKYGLPTYLRFIRGKKLKNGGWHFGYIGDISGIRNKINSIAEQSRNFIKDVDDESIRQIIDNGDDILKIGENFVNLKLNKLFPSYFLNNIEKYKNNVSTKNQTTLFMARMKHQFSKMTGGRCG